MHVPFVLCLLDFLDQPKRVHKYARFMLPIHSDAVPVAVLAFVDLLLRTGSMAGVCGAYLVTPMAYPTHIRITAFGFH